MKGSGVKLESKTVTARGLASYSTYHTSDVSGNNTMPTSLIDRFDFKPDFIIVLKGVTIRLWSSPDNLRFQ